MMQQQEKRDHFSRVTFLLSEVAVTLLLSNFLGAVFIYHLYYKTNYIPDAPVAMQFLVFYGPVGIFQLYSLFKMHKGGAWAGNLMLILCIAVVLVCGFDLSMVYWRVSSLIIDFSVIEILLNMLVITLLLLTPAKRLRASTNLSSLNMSSA
jgi:hypothetical protein